MSNQNVLILDGSDSPSEPTTDQQATEFLQCLIISRNGDGFSIRSKDGRSSDRLPTRIKIRAAYAVSRASNRQILSRYRTWDFRFDEEAISTEVIGARILDCHDNEVNLEIQKQGWRFGARGFDTNLALLVAVEPLDASAPAMIARPAAANSTRARRRVKVPDIRNRIYTEIWFQQHIPLTADDLQIEVRQENDALEFRVLSPNPWSSEYPMDAVLTIFYNAGWTTLKAELGDLHSLPPVSSWTKLDTKVDLSALEFTAIIVKRGEHGVITKVEGIRPRYLGPSA